MRYPTPQDVGIRIPTHLKEEDYRRGFDWALHGRQLCKPEHLRLSFRAGFRAAKLYLHEYRRSRGVLAFPMRAHVKLSSLC